MNILKDFLLIFAVILLLQACAINDDKNKESSAKKNNDSTDNIQEPVETKSPNTKYSPAFTGQTRIGGVKTSTPLSIVKLTTSLSEPWGITSLPDGRLLITEKGGTMRIVTASGKLSDEISGLLPVNSSGQGGLLGVRADPDFSSNRMLYWVFSEEIAGGNVTAVAKGRLSDNEKVVENPKVIYRALPPHKSTLHYGGRIVFDTSGNLFISTGERSVLETRPLAQDVSSGLGKIIHITTDGKPVSNNPLFEKSGALPELYSIGHRNTQGLAINPVTGELWQSEFGPRGGDEINIIKPGLNYGWPIITYGIEYSGEPINNGLTQKAGLEQPVYYWDPVVSPSGITFYTGDRIPEWQNNLFVGALSGQHIIRLVIENNRITGEERLLEDEDERFRDITEGNDGALYAITDSGILYRIDKK